MARIFSRIVLCAVFCGLLTTLLHPCFARMYAMSIKSKSPGVKLLEFKTAKLEMNLPIGYKLCELPLGERTTYMFMGPDDKTERHAVLSVDEMVFSDKAKTCRGMLDNVFKAYGKGSVGFKSEIADPITVAGKTFEKGIFSGSIDGDNSKGLAFAVRLKKAFVVMVARDQDSGFKTSEKVMMGIVKSCKIKSE